jgi:hypothetical protein
MPWGSPGVPDDSRTAAALYWRVYQPDARAAALEALLNSRECASPLLDD